MSGGSKMMLKRFGTNSRLISQSGITRTHHMKHTPIEIRPRTTERLADCWSTIDEEAFADTPKWIICYCQFEYIDHFKIGRHKHGFCDWRSA